MEQIKHLSTETRNEKSENIDTLDIGGIIKIINDEDKTVAYAIEKELEAIEAVISAMVTAYEKGGRIIYMGAGTSGRLGVLDSAECPPTFGTSLDRIVGLIAGGEKAFIHALENVEDSREAGVEDLKNIHLTAQDLVLGIAASGRTPYVEAGLIYATEVGASTATLTCNKGSKISAFATHNIEINVGPEVVTGSTRMKAGTAQKLVLTMMSTTLMIKMGKVYKNYMVDVKITNEKLRTRATNIVSEVTGCDYELAKTTLEKVNGHAKTAIVMILLDVDVAEAKARLEQSKDSVRAAIEK